MSQQKQQQQQQQGKDPYAGMNPKVSTGDTTIKGANRHKLRTVLASGCRAVA
jgi:hypothetical protein